MQQKRWYSHSCIISCRYFPFQKMPPLFQPVPMFQHDHIRLINLYILLFQPYIKKTFCKKSKYSFFIYAAPGQINPFFQLEKNRKKPGAKGVSCYLVGLVTCSIIEFLPIFFTYGLVSYIKSFLERVPKHNDSIGFNAPMLSLLFGMRASPVLYDFPVCRVLFSGQARRRCPSSHTAIIGLTLQAKYGNRICHGNRLFPYYFYY